MFASSERTMSLTAGTNSSGSPIDRVHRRREVFAIARHLKTLGHECETVKIRQAEWKILCQSRAADSGCCAGAFHQSFIELLRLRGVVLHQPRVEPDHQQMILCESGALQYAVLETPRHQERGCEQHQ